MQKRDDEPSQSLVSDSADPWAAARQASLPIISSWSLLRLMSIESGMPSNHLILCRSLLLLPQSFAASRSFPLSWLLASDNQSIGASALVLPMNIQGWFPLGLRVWSTCCSRGSQVFSSTAGQKRQFFSRCSAFLCMV